MIWESGLTLPYMSEGDWCQTANQVKKQLGDEWNTQPNRGIATTIMFDAIHAFSV